jgi:hypothetical protein
LGTVKAARVGNEPRDRLAMPRNHDFFPSLDTIQERTQLVLSLDGSNLRGSDLGHRTLQSI